MEYITSTTTPTDIPQAIERLADLLETGRIDKETFQAGLVLLGQKQEKKDIAGYM